MSITDTTITFLGEEEFNKLMESFIVPELKKYRAFEDAYLLPSNWSLYSKNQKFTNAYSFYVKTSFEEYRALIFKDHGRWLVCRGSQFYNSDLPNYRGLENFDYLKTDNRFVYFPRNTPQSLLDLYQNNPVYIDSLLEDSLWGDGYSYLKIKGCEELLKIRYDYESVYKQLSPLKISSATDDVDSEYQTRDFQKKNNPYNPLKECLRFIVNNKNLIPSPDLNGVYLFNDLEFSNIEDIISYLAKEIHLKNLAYKMKTRGLTQYDFMTILSPEDISTILKDINKGDNGNENTTKEVNAAE